MTYSHIAVVLIGVAKTFHSVTLIDDLGTNDDCGEGVLHKDQLLGLENLQARELLPGVVNINVDLCDKCCKLLASRGKWKLMTEIII